MDISTREKAVVASAIINGLVLRDPSCKSLSSLSQGHIRDQRCLDAALRYRGSCFLGERSVACLYTASRVGDLVLTSPIQYFLFDFDGVLADSEIHTLPTIERVAANYNLTWGKLRQEYGGWTWHAIADELLATTVSNAAALPPVDVLADELATAFSEAVLSAPISVHGAIGAVRAASKVGRVAVVTGSRGPLVEAWLQHFHVRDCVELS